MFCTCSGVTVQAVVPGLQHMSLAGQGLLGHTCRLHEVHRYLPQQAVVLQGNGYSSHEGPSSIGHHSQAPQEPHAQASSFQHANGHLHAPPANPDLGSGFSSGHSSGDLAQIPSPPPSQVSNVAVSFLPAAPIVPDAVPGLLHQ